MKTLISLRSFFLLTMFLATSCFFVGATHAQSSLAQQLRGQILLQVEQLGQAWYVEPISEKRFYLKDGDAAYELLHAFGLGITNQDLAPIQQASINEIKTMPSSCSGIEHLSGRILLQVENHGEAWYIWPENCHRIYLKDGDAAYEIMRQLSLGITDQNLNQIPQDQLLSPIQEPISLVEPTTAIQRDTAIANVKHYYANVDGSIAMDSLFLLAVALDSESFNLDVGLNHLVDPVYAESPYYRMLDYAFTMKREDLDSILESENNAFSSFEKAMIHALYCDVYGYDQADFEHLLTFRDDGYGDTHVLSIFNMLEFNNCHPLDELTLHRSTIANDIASKNDGSFSDLNSEKIVALYWAGYGHLVEQEWVDQIVHRQNIDFGWGGVISNPHTTGLSLLALIYFQEGAQKQNFYPLIANKVIRSF